MIPPSIRSRGRSSTTAGTGPAAPRARRIAVWAAQAAVLAVGIASVMWAFGFFSSKDSETTSAHAGPATAAQSVSTAEVTRGSIRGRAHLTGTVESADPRQVTSGVPGKLQALPVKEGAKVKQGQLLATLVDSDGTLTTTAANAQANLAKARLDLDTLEHPTADSLQVNQAKAAVQSAQEVLDNARRDLDRAEQNYDEAKDKVDQAKDDVEEAKHKASSAPSPSGSAGGSDASGELSEATADLTKAESKRDAAKSTRDARRDALTKAEESLHSAERSLATYQNLSPATQSKIAQARIQVTAAQTQFDVARRNLAALTVRSPVAGTVTSLPQTVGAPVTATSVIAQIDTGGFEVTASADAAVAGALQSHPTLAATVTLNGTSRVKALLRVVSPTTNSASDRTDVTFTLVPGKTVVRPGATAGIDVVMPEARGLVVPAAAIVSDGSDSVLFIAQGPDGAAATPSEGTAPTQGAAPTEGTAHRVKVTLAAADATRAVVLGDGLEAGSRVVVTGQTELTDGAAVQILPSATESPR